MSESLDGSPEDRLRDLFARQAEFRDKCWYRSAQRLSREIRQFAKSEGLVVPYLHACHQLMNSAQSLLDPQFGCEVAVEAIAVLESEERARLIQPDLPEDRYHYTVQWMSACSYDNLAKHVATREGYNSDGVHDCINDGIQVCRRTGKLECINCFREYATDVYRASDDLEMALHHARAVEQTQAPKDPDSGNDRRWVGAKDQIELQLLLGQLDAAFEAGQRALALHSKYHSPFDAKLDMSREMEVVMRLMGRFDEYPELMSAHDISPDVGAEIPSGEAPLFEVENAEMQALRLCCDGQFTAAAEVLTKFDQLLQARHCTANWFEVRLRLIACYLMAGDRARVDRLSSQLLDRAKTSRDWLTLRRLRGMLSGSVAVAPIPTVTDLKSGPFARRARSSGFDVDEVERQARHASLISAEANPLQGVPADSIDESVAATADDLAQENVSSELLERLGNWFDRVMGQTRKSTAAWDVSLEMMAVKPSDLNNAAEAGRLIHTLHIIAPMCGLGVDALRWAMPFLDVFPNDATLVNVVASLGMTARESAAAEKPPIDPESVIPSQRLHELFRRSLDLDPERPNNFTRAGQFYLTVGQIGDAERCFARAARLDRKNTLAARRLAEIYAQSDRNQDALNVLDLCIREGTDDPQVYWSAGMTALNAQQFQLVASYLQKYEQLAPGEPWIFYYLAVAYLETGRPQDALAALDEEGLRNPDTPFSLHALRACISALMGDFTEMKRQIHAVLAIPLATVDYLTVVGVSRLFVRLYESVRKLPTDDETRLQLEQRGLECGLAPDSYFAEARAAETLQENLSYYIVQFEQPVGDDWMLHPACLPQETVLTSYFAKWGVIAPDGILAERIALGWQARCHSLPPNLVSVELQGTEICERIGIAWQGIHEAHSAEAAQALSANMEDELGLPDPDEEAEEDDEDDSNAAFS